MNNNTLAETVDAPGGIQPSVFSWKTPTFPLPSPRAQPSGSNRVPGSVHSQRPRWTPEKHARILAQIKATRTDLDPSFPRKVPVPADIGQASAQAAVKGALHGAVQYAKSCFDAFTEHAIAQIYGPDHPTAAPVGAHIPAAPSDSWGMNPAARKDMFAHKLVETGLSDEQAMEVILAWTAGGIPLIEQTLPAMCKPEVTVYPEPTLKSGSSGALVMDVAAPDGQRLVAKCYPPPFTVDQMRLNRLSGIDAIDPKPEVRCLLASYFAHEVMQWEITPKASLGFISGRVCVLTPHIEGCSLQKRLDNDLSLARSFVGPMVDGIIHMESWHGRFGEKFQQDWTRLLVFSVLVGDVDRHFEQFIIRGKQPDFISGIDWDSSFGSKVTSDVIHVDLWENKYTSLWPDSIPKKICDEFDKVSKDHLRAAAEAFGLSSDEVASLMTRFDVITQKLKSLKKP